MDTQRNRVGWSEEQWNRINQAVHDEVNKARVAARFLPKYAGTLPPETRVVPAEKVDTKQGKVDDVTTLPLVEIGVHFFLNKQQIDDVELSGALVLARQAANILSRLEDAILFNGQPDVNTPPPSAGGLPRIFVRGGYKHKGIIGDGTLPPVKVEYDPSGYGDKIVSGVTEAMVRLEDHGHLGSFVLILCTKQFVEACRPMPGSLVLPKDRIDPLLDGNFFRTGVIEKDRGVLISLGGNPIDVAVSVEAASGFSRATDKGIYIFHVSERFALRFRVPEAAIRIEFIKKPGVPPANKATAEK